MTVQWYTGQDVAQAIADQRSQLKEQRARLASFQDWHRQQRKPLADGLDEASRELGRALLPRLDAQSIARAAEVSGLVTLTSYDIPGALIAERNRLENRMREILADPRYRDREMLRHPRTGSLTRAYYETMDFRKPWADVLVACHSHPRFASLWENGFGTDEYQGAWWRLSTYRDRSAASEITAMFPEKKTFGEVRDEYLRAKDTVAKLDVDAQRIVAEIQAGATIEKEYADLYEADRTLEQRWLEDTRGKLIRHMQSVDPNVLGARFDRAKELKVMYLRASGIAAKLAYLDQMSDERVRQELAEIAPIEQKMVRIAKYGRRGLPPEKFAAAFKDRRAKVDKSWQKFGKQYNRIYVFHHYERARIADDFLWWDLMTDGRVDGRFLPDVDHFYRAHPDYEYVPPPKHAATDTYDADIVDHASDRDDAANASDDDDGLDGEAGEVIAAAASEIGGSSTTSTDAS